MYFITEQTRYCGSAQDTASCDGWWFNSFSSGIGDVEIVNLARPLLCNTKTFNFTGVSGVETVNVGAGNVYYRFKHFDTGLTLNLSGQSTGAFDVGFATGTISGRVHRLRLA